MCICVHYICIYLMIIVFCAHILLHVYYTGIQCDKMWYKCVYNISNILWVFTKIVVITPKPFRCGWLWLRPSICESHWGSSSIFCWNHQPDSVSWDLQVGLGMQKNILWNIVYAQCAYSSYRSSSFTQVSARWSRLLSYLQSPHHLRFNSQNPELSVQPLEI